MKLLLYKNLVYLLLLSFKYLVLYLSVASRESNYCYYVMYYH